MAGFRKMLVGGVVSAVVLGGAVAVAGAGAAGASTFSVTNTNANGPGSLTQAITDANAHPGADTITFAPATNGHTIPEPQDDPGADLTITGNGAGITIVAGELNLNDTGGTTTITDLTIGDVNVNTGSGTTTAVLTNLAVVTDGVDINSGTGGHTTATLTNVKVTGAQINVNSGTHTSATIVDSSVENADDTGLNVNGEGTSVTVSRSTFSNNNGDGIDVNGAVLGLTNSTVAGNAVDGIDVDGNVTLQNDTVSNTGEGDVLAAFSGAISATNTIFTGTPGGESSGICSFDEASLTSHGGNVAIDDSCELTNAADHPHTDPHLGALGANGGSTKTMLPAAGSVAIDGGVASGCPSTDQRGVARPQDGNGDGTVVCDSGAVEIAGRAPATTTTTATPVTTAATPTTPATTGSTVAATATGPAQLPRTGSSSLPLGALGLALVAAGAAFGWGTRRRTA